MVAKWVNMDFLGMIRFDQYFSPFQGLKLLSCDSSQESCLATRTQTFTMHRFGPTRPFSCRSCIHQPLEKLAKSFQDAFSLRKATEKYGVPGFS